MSNSTRSPMVNVSKRKGHTSREVIYHLIVTSATINTSCLLRSVSSLDDKPEFSWPTTSIKYQSVKARQEELNYRKKRTREECETHGSDLTGLAGAFQANFVSSGGSETKRTLELDGQLIKSCASTSSKIRYLPRYFRHAFRHQTLVNGLEQSRQYNSHRYIITGSISKFSQRMIESILPWLGKLRGQACSFISHRY